jgi:hypothetical protein
MLNTEDPNGKLAEMGEEHAFRDQNVTIILNMLRGATLL